MRADKRVDVTLGGLHIEDDGVKIHDMGAITWYDLPYEAVLFIQRELLNLGVKLNDMGYAQLAEAQKAQQSTSPTV